ncbi:PAP2 superfamily protein [Pirellulimonas nuda]|uniref:PAP2 superfamily protein n=1 Tax=Pirellulimonas nuda TaxID=2528009 RepID=A0A518DAZ5_9BACT|nr:phosphatase PAP2 family protein [Pirellulimonas nuda]QDU88657.1 PAP2 superfamily protein [Pirellulimonas nuda]
MPSRDGTSTPTNTGGTYSRLWLVLLLLALVVGPASLRIDLPAARWFAQNPARGDLADGVQIAEFFGHGLGVVLILVVVATLDPKGRILLPRLATSSLGAGLVANVFKMLLERHRPGTLDLNAAGLWNTFGDWLPLLSHGQGMQSFPSAHTATAAGLAVALSAAYPRGRWLFVALCLGVGLQRMAVQAHFPSDVVYGGVVGAIWGIRCQVGLLGRWFDLIEALWIRGPNADPKSASPPSQGRSKVA